MEAAEAVAEKPRRSDEGEEAEEEAAAAAEVEGLLAPVRACFFFVGFRFFRRGWAIQVRGRERD